LSLVLYVYFLRVKFKIPFYLSTIALLAIPLVQVHATATYVDLPGSIGVSVFIMMTYLLYIKTDDFRKQDIFILFLGAACAANMRLKLIPLVFLVMCFTIYKIVFSPDGKKEMWNRNKKKFLKQQLVLLTALAIVFATPIKNTLLNGNPFYPVKIKIGSLELNHTRGFTLDPMIPGMETSRPERWLYSIFEITPRPFFRGNWSIDQHSDGLGNRYGGFFGAYVLFNLILFAYLAYRAWSRETKIAVILIFILSIITMWLPSSPQLRYYMYWMIVLVSLNLYFVSNFSRLGKLPKLLNEQNFGLAAGVALLLVVSSTKGVYVRPQFYSFNKYLENTVDRNILRQIQEKDSFCIPKRIRPHLFLYSSKFHPPSNYSIKICET